MTSPKNLPEATDIKRRKALRLSCSRCGLDVPVQAFEDPDHGDGWPQHKCLGFKVRPFDTWAPDARATQSKGAPFKDI